jgi:hypothetical protein
LKLKQGKFEVIDFDHKICDMTCLSNNQIVISAVDFLYLYDQNFKLIKSLNFKVAYITSNMVDKIYAIQCSANKITLLDLELDEIKSYGSVGSDINQFKNPYGTCFHNNFVYICDSDNKRIQKLSDNLEYINSFQIDFIPWLIQVANNIACIRSND